MVTIFSEDTTVATTSAESTSRYLERKTALARLAGPAGVRKRLGFFVPTRWRYCKVIIIFSGEKVSACVTFTRELESLSTKSL